MYKVTLKDGILKGVIFSLGFHVGYFQGMRSTQHQ